MKVPMRMQWPTVWLALRVAGCATAGGLVVGLWLAHRLATRRSAMSKVTAGGLALLLAVPVLVVAGLLMRATFTWQMGAVAGAIGAVAPVALGAWRTLADLNAGYGNAARSLGCSEWRIFCLVMMPLGWRTMALAAAVAFARAWVEWSIVAAL